MHETLGIAFVIFAVFHIVINWSSLKIHFKKNFFFLPLLVILALSITFIFLQRGNPTVGTLIVNRVVKSPISNAFKTLGVDSFKVTQTLEPNDIFIGNSKTIEEVWINNEASPEKVIDLILE